MPVTFTAGNSSVSAKAIDLITSAMLEMGALSPGEAPQAGEGAWGLEKLQRLIDMFNAQRELIYNVTFAEFTLQANHSPHTIGPGGNFDIPQRPIRLESAALILTDGTDIDLPLAVQDDDWWAAQTIKGLTSTVPTSVYYSPDNPLGNLYFWPVSTAVNGVRLQYWVNLTQAVNLQTTIAMPPAYWEAIVLSLALGLCPSFDRTPSPLLVANQRMAMAAVKQNNDSAPRMETRAAGMPRNRGASCIPSFNFLTGGRN